MNWPIWITLESKDQWNNSVKLGEGNDVRFFLQHFPSARLNPLLLSYFSAMLCATAKPVLHVKLDTLGGMTLQVSHSHFSVKNKDCHRFYSPTVLQHPVWGLQDLSYPCLLTPCSFPAQCLWRLETSFPWRSEAGLNTQCTEKSWVRNYE